MDGGPVIRPFRWDVSRRNELGSLARIEPPETYPGFEDDLLGCAARVLAFAGDSDLVFVGRSPQPLFDLLSGLLIDTTWRDRFRLLDLSLRYRESLIRARLPSIYPYFTEVGLDPQSLTRRSRTIALVDVVWSGWTMGGLIEILEAWTRSQHGDWPAAARKLRVVGLTERRRTSPNTWRWQQHAEWVDRLTPQDIKNVSVPPRLWGFLGDRGPKTSGSFGPDRWGDAESAKPVRNDEARAALALAVRLFDLGREARTRLLFARLLAGEPAMTERWFRSLVLEVKS